MTELKRKTITITEMDGNSYLLDVNCGDLKQTVAASNLDHALQVMRMGFQADAIPVGIRPAPQGRPYQPPAPDVIEFDPQPQGDRGLLNRLRGAAGRA